MAKNRTDKDIAAILDEEAEAIDADREAPVTESSKVTRGNGSRSKTLQIRLNAEELHELERLASKRGLPTSTLAREAILRLIEPAASRSAAASRVVDEFSRYVDLLDEELATHPRRRVFDRIKAEFPSAQSPDPEAVIRTATELPPHAESLLALGLIAADASKPDAGDVDKWRRALINILRARSLTTLPLAAHVWDASVLAWSDEKLLSMLEERKAEHENESTDIGR
jgi:predicted DNA-binding protein